MPVIATKSFRRSGLSDRGFSKGFGDILSFVGIVIGLGTMIGGLLVSSGGADAFANAMISIGGRKYVPWTLFAAFLIWLAVVFRSRVCSPRDVACTHQSPTPGRI